MNNLVDFTKVQANKLTSEFGNVQSIGVSTQKLSSDQPFYVVELCYYDADTHGCAVFLSLDKDAANAHAKRLADATGLKVFLED